MAGMHLQRGVYMTLKLQRSTFSSYQLSSLPGWISRPKFPVRRGLPISNVSRWNALGLIVSCATGSLIGSVSECLDSADGRCEA